MARAEGLHRAAAVAVMLLAASPAGVLAADTGAGATAGPDGYYQLSVDHRFALSRSTTLDIGYTRYEGDIVPLTRVLAGALDVSLSRRLYGQLSLSVSPDTGDTDERSWGWGVVGGYVAGGGYSRPSLDLSLGVSGTAYTRAAAVGPGPDSRRRRRPGDPGDIRADTVTFTQAAFSPSVLVTTAGGDWAFAAGVSLYDYSGEVVGGPEGAGRAGPAGRFPGPQDPSASVYPSFESFADRSATAGVRWHPGIDWDLSVELSRIRFVDGVTRTSWTAAGSRFVGARLRLGGSYTRFSDGAAYVAVTGRWYW